MGLDDQITQAKRAYDARMRETKESMRHELGAAQYLNTLYARAGGSLWQRKAAMGTWERADGLWVPERILNVLRNRYGTSVGEVLMRLDGSYPVIQYKVRRPKRFLWLARWHYFWHHPPLTLSYLFYCLSLVAGAAICAYVAINDYPWCAFFLATLILGRRWTGGNEQTAEDLPLGRTGASPEPAPTPDRTVEISGGSQPGRLSGHSFEHMILQGVTVTVDGETATFEPTSGGVSEVDFERFLDRFMELWGQRPAQPGPLHSEILNECILQARQEVLGQNT